MGNPAADRRRYARLALGVLFMLLLGVGYAWSILRAPLSAVFPAWTPTAISLTFTLSMSFLLFFVQ